jgi:hypothetical protein
MTADVLHISKHHWRDAAIDYVAAKGGSFGMAHVFEFSSREEWLQANTLEENANVFTARPKFKAFLAPNQGVDEWPLLYEHFDGANGKSSGQDENGDQDSKPPPESLCQAAFIRVKDDDLSSENVAMDTKQPDIGNRKKGARKKEVPLNVLTSERNIRNDSLARLTDNKSTEENTFCLSNNGNEHEAVTDVAVQDQKSSDGMDNTRSWVDGSCTESS